LGCNIEIKEENKMKKLVSILSTLVLALQLTTVSAAAEPAYTVKVGELNDANEFTVEVELSGVDYWSDLTFEVDYDSTAMGLKKAASNSALVGLDVWGDPEASITRTKSPSKSSDPQYFNYISPYQACTYNGIVASMTFKLTDGAVPGKTYDITVQPSKGPEGNFVDGVNTNFFTNKQADDEIDTVPFGQKVALGVTYVSGSITIPGGAVETTLAATKADGAVSITATGEEITGKFIVAGYDAEGLVDVEVIDAAATATASVDGETIKVMWWDSIEGMTSIAPAVTL
jgi:hypothetical protein